MKFAKFTFKEDQSFIKIAKNSRKDEDVKPNDRTVATIAMKASSWGRLDLQHDFHSP